MLLMFTLRLAWMFAPCCGETFGRWPWGGPALGLPGPAGAWPLKLPLAGVAGPWNCLGRSPRLAVEGALFGILPLASTAPAVRL